MELVPGPIDQLCELLWSSHGILYWMVYTLIKLITGVDPVHVCRIITW